MKNCPRCGLSLEPNGLPQMGEVWLRVETGYLYRITESSRSRDKGVYAGAERIRPPSQGYDVEAAAAIWPDQVRSGRWIRIENPSAEDCGSG